MGDDVPAIQNENEVTQPLPAADPAPVAETPAGPQKPSWRTLAVPTVAALIIGVGAGYALHDVTSDSGSGRGNRGFPTFANGTGNGFQGQGQGQGQGGGFQGQGAPPQGGFGGVQGEERIQGTVTGTTGSSVTVKSSSGTATYTVNATSQIVANGQAGSLSDVKTGDTVFLHVIPASSGSDKVVERLFVGGLPQGGPGFGGDDDGRSGGGSGGMQTF